MSICSGSGWMFPLPLLYVSDIRRTQSHTATMTECWHRVVDVCLPPAGWRAVGVTQKQSVIWNQWSSSDKEPLWCPNKRGFDKSHVHPDWNPWMTHVVRSSLKPDFLFKNKGHSPGYGLVASLQHHPAWKVLSNWKQQANSAKKTRQTLMKGHVLFVYLAFLI